MIVEFSHDRNQFYVGNQKAIIISDKVESLSTEIESGLKTVVTTASNNKLEIFNNISIWNIFTQ